MSVIKEQVNTIEECCEMIKLQGVLLSEKLSDDEQFYIKTLNQIADRILELRQEEQSVNSRTIIQNYDAKELIENFFKRNG